MPLERCLLVNLVKLVCEIENIFQDGDWAILEWKDPKGLRGRGVFNIVNGGM